jgi:hypothetical protein
MNLVKSARRSPVVFVPRGILLAAVAFVVLACGIGASESRGQVIVNALGGNQIRYPEESWSRQIFGNQPAETARALAGRSLQLRLEAVDREVSLSESQRSKLELAGEGDIHRFFAEYERVRDSCMFGQISRDDLQELMTKAQPLQKRYQNGLHDGGSLFDKMVSSILTGQQRETLDAMREERRRREYRDRIRISLMFLDRKLPMTAAQRDEVTELLVEHTAPPQQYGNQAVQLVMVLGQLAKVPNDRLRALFGDDQWEVMQSVIETNAARQRMHERAANGGGGRM